MIDIEKAKPGFHVFYQRPHMRQPEYGVITSTRTQEATGYYDRPATVFVRFGSDEHSKACRPNDLYWPPDYCSIHQCNPEGQPFSRLEEMPNA